MRRVEFVPTNHVGIDKNEWKKWSERANNAQERMLKWHEAKQQTVPPAHPPPQPDFQDAVWKKLKDLILEPVFRGRCAYCEHKANVGGFGDAEHYRPKNSVHALDHEHKLKPIHVGPDEHPGYHWLAYDWENLTPACSQCNNQKGAQFPVVGTHCTGPEPGKQTTRELNACEQPLLLHPYFDEPEQHLSVGVRGIIAAKKASPRGQATIDLCYLDREPLREAREKAQIAARNEIKALRFDGKNSLEAIRIIMQRCQTGDEEFSLAIREELYRIVTEFTEERQRELEEANKILAARKD